MVSSSAAVAIGTVGLVSAGVMSGDNDARGVKIADG
jgi:hypothetical protein